MEIEFKNWQNLDLRVGEILSVEDHPNADRLYVLNIKIKKEIRTIVAGIKNSYPKEDLIGKMVIVFANLKPTLIRGIKSEGMILAASNKKEVILITPDKKINSGARIS